MLTNLQAATIEHFGTGKDSHAEARRKAGKLFDRVYSQGKRNRLFARMGGKAKQLKSISGQAQANNRTMRTILVPLSQIVGTEGRSEDFDRDFKPLKGHNRERWISVASARRMGIVLPLIELVKAGNEYFVRDGHHRVSVAKAMGQMEIEAVVVN